jgi:uncharacterized protein YdiU (UPF0061 family)
MADSALPLTFAAWNLHLTYASLPGLFYTRALPVPASQPRVVISNNSLATSLGLNAEALAKPESAAVFAGNDLPPGADPIAQAYAGHQFGHFTMLGDGRAILLGEQVTPDGQRFDIQLKGSGRTPYSRGGDGRAALGPMLREYIISEAMHALGIPTTRSLAVTLTGDPVYRGQRLDGAILTRAAASHIRVGTFEWAAARGSNDDLRALADYTIQRHYPDAAVTENPTLSFLQSVIARQAALIARWLHVGFIHGVMNTDNMALSGETIDYGPCAFMDIYDPATVFSSIDQNGRYAYANQQHIAQWNLARFAETLLPLLHPDEDEALRLANDAIRNFTPVFEAAYLDGMRKKLGLANAEPDDLLLIQDFLQLLHDHRLDYTNTFGTLTTGTPADAPILTHPDFGPWHQRRDARLTRQQASRTESTTLMRRSNPAVIPRNHLVEAALAAATTREDFSVLERLLEVLSQPFNHDHNLPDYQTPPSPGASCYQTYCGT